MIGKGDKRGISAIVATVLIILITVAAVTIIWVVVLPLVKQGIDVDNIDVRISIETDSGYTYYDIVKRIGCVQVGRAAGKGNLVRIKTIFSFEGETFLGNFTGGEIPGENQAVQKCFNLTRFSYEPGTVSIAPIVLVNGKEVEGPITSTVTLGPGNYPGGAILDYVGDECTTSAQCPEDYNELTCVNNHAINRVGSYSCDAKVCVAGPASVTDKDCGIGGGTCLAGVCQYQNPISSCGEVLSSSGTTYSLVNNITSPSTCINVTADNVILNLNGFTISSTDIPDEIGSDAGVYVDGSSNVEIFGGNINGFDRGIYLDNSDSSNIHDDVFTYNYYGVYVDGGSENTLYSNELSSDYEGFYIDSSDKTVIHDNEMTGNDGYNVWGIDADGTAEINISNNKLHNFGNAIRLNGDDRSGMKYVQGNEISDARNVGIDISHIYMGMNAMSNNRIYNFGEGMINSGIGINVSNANYVTLEYNILYNHSYGIIIGDNSHNNYVQYNNVSGAGTAGVYVGKMYSYSSTDTIDVRDTTVQYNNISGSSTGISTQATNRLYIARNNINATHLGIDIWYHEDSGAGSSNKIEYNVIYKIVEPFASSDDCAIKMYGTQGESKMNSIDQNELYGFSSGICLQYFDVPMGISNNIITGGEDSYHGIHLSYIDEIGPISGNTISGFNSSNSGSPESTCGIYMSDVDSPSISSNVIFDNYCGIYLHHVDDGEIYSNTLTDNTRGIRLDGTEGSNNNSVHSNSVCGAADGYYDLNCNPGGGAVGGNYGSMNRFGEGKVNTCSDNGWPAYPANYSYCP
jgi:parallel beta-helix repeat protein